MRTRCGLCIFFLMLTLGVGSVAAQEFDQEGQTGVYGYTSVYFDPSTNTVSAYSETDLYGYAVYEYSPFVVLQSNGLTANGSSPEGPSASASLSYPASPGTTYFAYGTHGAEAIQRAPSGEGWQDYYGLYEWLNLGIESPWEYAFPAFEGDISPMPNLQVGTTYDSAAVSTPASCGNGDQRNTIIQEYVNYLTPYFPQCNEFTQTLNDPNFSFGQLNSGTYSWAILRPYFISKIDSLRAKSNFTVNSAYRNPSKEWQVSISVNGGKYHPGSRHQYGDALDVATTSATWPTYQTYGHQLGACVEPTAVQGGSTAHAHLDWRTLATVGPAYPQCPTGW